MKSTDEMLAGLKAGHDRNYNETRQTPFTFFAPVMQAALNLMSGHQRAELEMSEAWREVVKSAKENCR